MDMEALKAAVERSNREKDINIQSAMKNASEAILSDLKGVVDSYKAEVEQPGTIKAILSSWRRWPRNWAGTTRKT